MLFQILFNLNSCSVSINMTRERSPTDQTCQFPAHHQERTTALGASGLTVAREAAGASLVAVWQTTTNNAPAAFLRRLNQRVLVHVYAPDDGRGDARNTLSHT